MMVQHERWTLRALRGGSCRWALGLVALVVSTAGCNDTDPTGPGDALWDLEACALNVEYVADGGIGLDGIPALSTPILVGTNAEDQFAYLRDSDRVIGIEAGGQSVAIPLGALWYHEIVNLQVGDTHFAVTHSTLSGTSRVYRRSSVAGATFGVSGLLYRNNLLLYDRAESPTLWIQMTGQGACGPLMGASLTPHPSLELTWAGWKSLHPGTRVLSAVAANSAAWGQYPYSGYESSEAFYFPDAMPTLDPRRPPKERVLGIPEGDVGGIAFPFGALDEAGAVAVAHATVEGQSVVVFWRRALIGAAAYRARAEGQDLTFEVVDGEVRDVETGTAWSFLGVGSDGPLSGASLDRVATATVTYWGAWAAFQSGTEIWTGNDGS